MSISLTRSPRKTEFWKNKTPKGVGPGAYNHIDLKSSYENVAPFSSMQERALHTIDDNPGPGTYSEVRPKKVQARVDQRSGAFKSLSPRFAPRAPGSTVFKTSTLIDNPGPGCYYKAIKYGTQPKVNKPDHGGKIHKELVLKTLPVMIGKKLRAKTASIPGRKIPSKGYKGEKEDTVGPGNYTPSYNFIKNTNTSVDFAKSKQKRKIFEHTIEIENKLPSFANPGPGDYENSLLKSNNFNVAGHSSFISTVPNCKQMAVRNAKNPGPGRYEADVSSVNRKTLQASIESKNEAFISKTKRGDFWQHDPEVPFTQPFKNTVPGPGQYQFDTKGLYDSFNADAQAPFNSTSKRVCVERSNKKNAPGPGQYIEIDNPIHSSVTKGLLKFATDRGIMEAHGIARASFGTTQKRFHDGYFKPHKGPGPGDYKEEIAEMGKFFTTGINSRPDTHECKLGFNAKAERFEEAEKNNPDVRIVGKKENERIKKIASDVLRSSHEQINELNKPKWIKQNRASDYNNLKKEKIGFDTTNPRFGYEKAKLSTHTTIEPGPGHYEITKHRGMGTAMSTGMNMNSLNHSVEMPSSGKRSILDTQNNTNQNNQNNQHNQHIEDNWSESSAKKKYSIVNGVNVSGGRSGFNCSTKKFQSGISYYRPTTGTTKHVGPGSYINDSTFIKKSFNLTMENSFFL